MPEDPQRGGYSIEGFAARFGADAHAVQASRRNFVGWMCAADVDGDTIDELEIVFSELAANAVAASPTTSHEVRARAQLDDGMLMLEVSNLTENPAQLPLSNPDLDDPHAAERAGAPDHTRPGPLRGHRDRAPGLCCRALLSTALSASLTNARGRYLCVAAPWTPTD